MQVFLSRQLLEQRRVVLVARKEQNGKEVDPAMLIGLLLPDEPVPLHHPAVQSLLSEQRIVLRPVGRGVSLTLPFFMQQAGGVFVVEFYWRKQLADRVPSHNWHVIVVNCDWRMVFCNTLGAIPFSDIFRKESKESHAKVSSRFSIQTINKVWGVFTKRMTSRW